jgi:hypothetical protein
VSSPALRFLGYGPGRGSRSVGLVATAAFVIGGLLVLWSAYIHFHLWDETNGYRHISVIGPLFLLQAIGGLVVAILIVAVRRVWVALAGIGFAASTLVGFLLSVGLSQGLFNFKETWAAPFADQAFAIEIAIAAVLLIAGGLCLAGSASTTRSGPAPTGSALSGA